MNRIKSFVKKLKKKHYRRMMNICLDKYLECGRKFWFKLFSKYFDKLFEDEGLRMVSCAVNKIES